ncbi:MAG: hypothetical protein JST80_13230 [Bdellovibrionales bacterium]|nr:hypothetical protein [Bdellovibrionales bacterium]
MKKESNTAESILSQLDPDKLKEAASNAADEAAKFIKKHPLESIGAALVAGVLIGLLINRK